MDLLRDNVRAVYRKYFLAAFGSALISCIYGVVDISGALILLLPEVLGPAAIW